jgi:hypothetical protein
MRQVTAGWDCAMAGAATLPAASPAAAFFRNERRFMFSPSGKIESADCIA